MLIMHAIPLFLPTFGAAEPPPPRDNVTVGEQLPLDANDKPQPAKIVAKIIIYRKTKGHPLCCNTFSLDIVC